MMKYIDYIEYSTLEEKVRFLEECLDRKEVLNTRYRKEIKNLTKCNLNLQEHIDKVEEENKKLNEYNGELIESHKKDIAILCEENKKLEEKLEVSDAMRDNDNLEQEGDWNYIEELEEENRKLKEEIERLKNNAMQDMKELTDLETENTQLKKRLRLEILNDYEDL